MIEIWVSAVQNGFANVYSVWVWVSVVFVHFSTKRILIVIPYNFCIVSMDLSGQILILIEYRKHTTVHTQWLAFKQCWIRGNDDDDEDRKVLWFLLYTHTHTIHIVVCCIGFVILILAFELKHSVCVWYNGHFIAGRIQKREKFHIIVRVYISLSLIKPYRSK